MQHKYSLMDKSSSLGIRFYSLYMRFHDILRYFGDYYILYFSSLPCICHHVCNFLYGFCMFGLENFKSSFIYLS